MIHHRLNSVSRIDDALPADSHLDEDTITAFVEGRIGSSVSQSVLSHLVACATCRYESAQLIRLESEIQNQLDSPSVADEESNRLRLFLDSLRSAVTGSNEDVVFAYQNPPADDEDAKDTKPTNHADQSDQENSKAQS